MGIDLNEKVEHNKFYAGYWSRTGAFIIDWIISVLLALIVSESITVLSLIILNIKGANTRDFVMVQQYPALIGTWVSIIVFTLYFSLMDSSRHQATLGKMVFKIQTVDINQNKISFWRALLRYIIMWSIPIILVGQFVLIAIFVMAIPIIFTSRKQGIYDMIAGCLVIKKDVVDEVLPNQNAIQGKPDVNQEECV